jgi:outer membrane immunogenic protein
MRKVLFASAALAALTAGSAGAADLPYRAPVAPTPMATYFNWTGLYVGINGGGAWGNNYGDVGFASSGGMVGGTIGVNYQITNWVLGLEADWDWANINGSTTGVIVPVAFPAGTTMSSNINSLGTFRGRLGVAFDRALIYVTGGLAWATNNYTLDGLGQSSATHTGWTIGGGLEYGLTQNWSIKAEYMWVDTGTRTYTWPVVAGVTPTASEGWRGSVVRAGLNYRFNWGGPVVARY